MTVSSQISPCCSNCLRMLSLEPGTSRGGSISSMRTSHLPARCLTLRKLASAVTREPKCSGPVGDGAKRPIMVLFDAVLKIATGSGRMSVDPALASSDLFFFYLIEGFTIYTELSRWSCLQTADTNFNTTLVAKTIIVFFNTNQCLINFFN